MTKIDEAMIERAWQAWPLGESPKVIIKRILEAALAKPGPAKGPIIATDEQAMAARQELARMRANKGTTYSARQEARNVAQAVVNAALQPPEEIPVSEGMIRAGKDAYLRAHVAYENEAAAVYRAMESARRAEASKCKVCGGKPKPWYAMPCVFCPPAERSHNRRKDDPK